MPSKTKRPQCLECGQFYHANVDPGRKCPHCHPDPEAVRWSLTDGPNEEISAS